MRRTILWVAALAALIAIPAVIGLVAFRGDDSSSSARRAGALVTPGGATPYQLQLTQPAGSPNAGIKDAIEVESYSWSAENPTTIGSATGGASSGKIKFNELTINKKVDRASPLLFKQMAVGANYAKAVLSLKKAAEKNAYMTYTLETAFITKISHGGNSPEVGNEQITFVFGKLGVQSIDKAADGSELAPVQTGWDQVLNRDWPVP